MAMAKHSQKNHPEHQRMKPKHQRMLWIAIAAISIGLGATLIGNVFRNHLVFFFSPSDIAAGKAPTNRTLRAGGLVKQGSVKTPDAMHLHFTLTDGTVDIPVQYEGIQPPMFREGQGVVAEGTLAQIEDAPTLTANKLLTKHDENYMPPEVVDALKQSGQWQHAAPGSTTP